MMNTQGIHHVTAIASDPQRNVDFYTDVLGLRLVKKTVNFDDKFTYHLYYGDEVGTPGTIMTFFPFEGGRPGQVGRGQTSATGFVIPPGSVEYWTDRLAELDVDVHESPHDSLASQNASRSGDVNESVERFGETVIPFRDHDGQQLELVASDGTDVEPWGGGPVPAEHAIRGFHGVTLLSAAPEATESVLETLGYEPTDEKGDRVRYRSTGERAAVVDVLHRSDPPRGRMGAGTVHHIAFRTAGDDEQGAWRETLSNDGLSVTPVKDRQYFRSIYFREPGGVLFEIATDGPGFTRDESREELGTDLKLPPWLEDDREMLEAQLPEVRVRTATEAGR